MKAKLSILLIGLAVVLIAAKTHSGGGTASYRCTGVITPNSFGGSYQEMTCGSCHFKDTTVAYTKQGIQPNYDRLQGNYAWNHGSQVLYKIFVTGWHINRNQSGGYDTLGNPNLARWAMQLQVTDTNYRPINITYAPYCGNFTFSQIGTHDYVNIYNRPLNVGVLPNYYQANTAGHYDECDLGIIVSNHNYRGNILIHACYCLVNNDGTVQKDFDYCVSDIVFYQAPFSIDFSHEVEAEKELPPYSISGNRVIVNKPLPYHVSSIDGKSLKVGVGPAEEIIPSGVYVFRMNGINSKILVR